jgi:hypothetical protein
MSPTGTFAREREGRRGLRTEDRRRRGGKLQAIRYNQGGVCVLTDFVSQAFNTPCCGSLWQQRKGDVCMVNSYFINHSNAALHSNWGHSRRSPKTASIHKDQM